MYCPQKYVSLSWDFKFVSSFLENVYHVREISLISTGNLITAFYVPSKKNLRHSFVDEWQLKKIMSKKNISPNIPYIFFPSKLVHSFKISLREKRVLSFALVGEWNANNSIHFAKCQIFTGMEILWKDSVSEVFRSIRQKTCGSCAFPQNFHTRKLGENLVFYALIKKVKA